MMNSPYSKFRWVVLLTYVLKPCPVLKITHGCFSTINVFLSERYGSIRERIFFFHCRKSVTLKIDILLIRVK